MSNESKYKVKIAKITSTMLGIDDHGIFTCSIGLEYGLSSQAFGQYDLRYKHYGISFIKKILDIAGVSTWEELEGQYIRANACHEKIKEIGHITKEKWFRPEGSKDENL